MPSLAVDYRGFDYLVTYADGITLTLGEDLVLHANGPVALSVNTDPTLTAISVNAFDIPAFLPIDQPASSTPGVTLAPSTGISNLTVTAGTIAASVPPASAPLAVLLGSLADQGVIASVPLADLLPLGTIAGTSVAIQGTVTSARPLLLYPLPAPGPDGIAIADISSATLAALPGSGVQPAFVSGTEVIVLTDGALSLGPDTNEAAVQRLYVTLLGRGNADAITNGIWDAQLDAGRTTSDIAEQFLVSPEFAAAHPGLTNGAFVALLFQNALGRAPGDSVWTDRLDAGLSRADAAAAIAESTEAKQHLASATAGVFARNADGTLVHLLYETGLGREAELSGLAVWKDRLATISADDMAAQIGAGPEFAARHAGQNDADYVASLYRDGLGRTPDVNETSHWTGLLASFTSRATVFLDIATSTEAYARLPDAF